MAKHSIAAGALVTIAVCAVAATVDVECGIALSSALPWLTAAITGVHAVREALRSHG
ncbi:hypothetical protein ACIHCM_04945 [Streptomyces sp. NPDC052023]|uniref:hypothetical protein n=1 Tax=Streptomyces sp. NPDC052023 TaxID=3365681 RepID=UPI0037CCFB26